jgi:pachytene checkpoint protein 2
MILWANSRSPQDSGPCRLPAWGFQAHWDVVARLRGRVSPQDRSPITSAAEAMLARSPSKPHIIPSRSKRQVPAQDAPGVALATLLPDVRAQADWDCIVLPAGAKDRLARQAAMSFVLRQKVEHAALPLHGAIGLFGPPGTGKTTLARGLGDAVARVVRDIGDFLLVEVDAHGLTGAMLGRSQKAVDSLFRDQVPQWGAEGPVVLILDEVETIAADRAKLSLQANPFDVHRASDAALVGLDYLGRNHPEVMVIITSNFASAVDPALISRVDVAYQMPLPDAAAAEAILRDTLAAVTRAFPGAGRVATSPRFGEAVAAAVGLDGRQLRKVVGAACSVRATGDLDPGNLTVEDLLLAIAEAKT